MERNLMIAGFGGQGVMLMGKLLAYSVCELPDANVTFFPSYGAEQRGGTANCYVVISDREIGAPLGNCMDDLVVMNSPSLNQFLHKLRSGGTLFINSTIVTDKIDREDIHVVSVPASGLSLELGNPKVLNIIMLGAYIGYTDIISEDIVRDTIIKKLGKKESLIAINQEAFAKGLAIGKNARSGACA